MPEIEVAATCRAGESLLRRRAASRLVFVLGAEGQRRAPAWSTAPAAT
jgi:hypothetical protein